MKPMTNLEFAKSLIDDIDTWTKFCYARDIRKNKVHVQSPLAKSFCISGACEKANVSDETYARLQTLAEEMLIKLNCLSIKKYTYKPDYAQILNDDYGHEAVITLLDKVIKEEKENIGKS